MGNRILFNDNWEFASVYLEEEEKDGVGALAWEKVDIPHDMLIYDSYSFGAGRRGYYRKSFHMEEVKKDSCYLIRFEGVYMDSRVWVNKELIGEWKYGYSTFEFNITAALQEGENEIQVEVLLQTPNSRWYSGGGIYRNIWFKEVPKTHIASDGIYVSTKEEGDGFLLFADTEIVGQDGVDDNNSLSDYTSLPYRVVHSLFDMEGNEVALESVEDSLTMTQKAVQKDRIICLQQAFFISSPRKWDILEPNLYFLHTKIVRGEEILDKESTRFGFRTISYHPNHGFFLNGRHVKLHGACQHHDLGALGSAVNTAALKRQISILKEMGVNSIRTAHNMPAVELLDLADEMGILINEESFDMWERPKTAYDYARFFPEWVEKDVKSWIRRDRNHPSIIMWCIGNEISDTHVDERGQETTRKLVQLVHQHDYRHNAPVTIGSNYMPWENARKCGDIVKITGYNYGEKYYEAHHKEYPDWVIMGSETSSVVQSRGIYHFPLEKEILSDDDEQCSSLGNSITSWGARSIEACIINDRDAVFSAGMYIWSGFDYIGEPTPYHTKNSYFGQIDTAGFKKDSFYIYQAAWTDYKVSPMVHVFPYWDFNEGQIIDVRVCSNAPKVELFLNHKSLGIFLIDQKHGKQLVGNWKVPYVTGEIKAVAYDEKDRVIAVDKQVSFTDPTSIVVRADKETLLADGRDMIFAEISMIDCNGNPVENANNRVEVSVRGAGRLVGLDNGDSTDYDSYKGSSRRLFSGKLLCMIMGKMEAGDIYMEVTSPNLPSVTCQFTALPVVTPIGISALEENHKGEYIEEVPIRKLELVSPFGTHLTKALEEVTVEVVIHPKNATYEDIDFRVTNSTGVDTNIAKVRKEGRKAIVTALGDGEFYLRATAKNGSKKIRLISSLDFKVSGMGSAYYNPYELVSGSLYEKTIGEIGSGNERGIATARDGESGVFYSKLDFGEIGSDTITLPIFELGSKPVQIEIWEGMPREEGAYLLADIIYHKPSKWNTYQEETYVLNKRLKGITSLSFLLRDKIHLKGFTFLKPYKAFEQLEALYCNRIYGDSYVKGEEAITGIGNNVTLSFDDMDFGERGMKGIRICGRTRLNKNVVVMAFLDEEGEMKQMAEFNHSSDYTIQEFTLDSVKGMKRVEFIFLPGSDFDFKWFQFI